MTSKVERSTVLGEAPKALALDEAFRALNELGPEGGFQRFAASFNSVRIEAALRSMDKASFLRRKFTAEQAWVNITDEDVI